MPDFDSNIRRHAETGPKDAWASSKLWQLVTVVLFGGAGALAFGLPVEGARPGWGAVAGLIGFVVALVLRGLLMRLWSERRKQKAVVLQKQLHALKQQEFALRYAEAKARGDVQ